MFQIEDKDYLIRVLFQACFKCSKSFWGKMSVIMTNLFEETDPGSLLIILGNLVREDNLHVEHWRELIKKFEKIYNTLPINSKVNWS